jgi:hypothetical protein
MIFLYSYRYGVFSDYGADQDRMQFRYRKLRSPLALIPELVVFIFIELKDALPSYIVIYCRCDLAERWLEIADISTSKTAYREDRPGCWH